MNRFLLASLSLVCFAFCPTNSMAGQIESTVIEKPGSSLSATPMIGQKMANPGALTAPTLLSPLKLDIDAPAVIPGIKTSVSAGPVVRLSVPSMLPQTFTTTLPQAPPVKTAAVAASPQAEDASPLRPAAADSADNAPPAVKAKLIQEAEATAKELAGPDKDAGTVSKTADLETDLFENPPYAYHIFTPTDRQAGGSQNGVWFQDQRGDFYFGKSYDGDVERVLAEHLANEIYERMGVGVPKTILRRIDGVPYILSKETPGQVAASAHDLARTDLSENFVVDAWLANWDVVGLGFDNVIIDSGHAVRVDNAGSMMWKATGGRKEFPSQVMELSTMRDPSHWSGQVFQSLTDVKITAQIRKFARSYAANRDDIRWMVRQSGLDRKTQQQLLTRLDGRARWLLTRGLDSVTRSLPEAGKPRQERLTDEIRAELGDSSWNSILMEARKEASEKGGAVLRLTDGELMALKMYAGGEGEAYNAALRGIPYKHDNWVWAPESRRQEFQIKAYAPEIELTISALSKLPNYRGRVQRRTGNNTARYRLGRPFREKGFLSTTLGGEPPYPGWVSFDIISRTGKDISVLGVPGEGEVLFAPGAVFDVTQKQKDPNGEWHITMVERPHS